jgi:hypothetical protein
MKSDWRLCLRLVRLAAVLGALVAGLAASSCEEFHGEGPEDATPTYGPAVVAVSLEYAQAGDCPQAPGACEGSVLFYGSWMTTGTFVTLERIPGTRVFRGRATGVPANYPPRAGAYLVRVYDPNLSGGPTLGYTGFRIVLGSEALSLVTSVGQPQEAALVYIDQDGFGHNPT